MTTKILSDRIETVAGLFKHHTRRRCVIEHILEGNAGSADVDDVTSPRVARLSVGNITLFSGDPSLAHAQDLVANLRAIVVPETSDWHDLIYDANKHQDMRVWNRIDHSSADLDPRHLHRLTDQKEAAFRVVPMDAELVDQVGDVLGAGPGRFRSVEQFLKLGFGLCGFLDDELVTAAFSGSVSRFSVAIQIDTHRDYRQRGFATAIGARFILDCLEKGLTPEWNAATQISAALARKLGYVECDTYEEFQFLQ